MPDSRDGSQGSEDQGNLSYQQEIEDALNDDPQRIGDVWRLRTKHGENAEGIRADLNVKTVGTVHSSLGLIDTLLNCKRSTNAPTLALQRARALRSFAKRHEKLSPASKHIVEELATEHQRVADDEEALANETEQIARKGGLSRGQPGIYVYALPHYLRFPVSRADSDESNPRTYLKVGMSNVDAKGRVRQQVTTALPEPPRVLRRYVLQASNADYRRVEDRMHRHLNAADHNQNRQRGAGKEWFLTHLTFVDSTADILGLAIEYEDEDYPSVL